MEYDELISAIDYEDGIRLNYLAPYLGIFKVNSRYGEYSVHISLPISYTDVALKYDSLRHYYNDQDEFDMDACNKDFAPYANIDILLSDKFSKKIRDENVEELKRTITIDPDSLEILTSLKTSWSAKPSTTFKNGHSKQTLKSRVY